MFRFLRKWIVSEPARPKRHVIRSRSARGEYVESRIDEVRQWAEQGLGAPEIATHLSSTERTINFQLIYAIGREHGVNFKGHRGPRKKAADPRIDRMEELYLNGKTLKQIGLQYGITRERVRQLLKPRGIGGKHGGRAITAKRRRAAKDLAREMKTLRRYGCTFEQRLELLRLNEDMRKRGLRPEQTITYAYTGKKNWVVHHQHQEWHLSLWEFWSVWKESGKWFERQRGANGYGLTRKDRNLPWTLSNVMVAPNSTAQRMPRVRKARAA